MKKLYLSALTWILFGVSYTFAGYSKNFSQICLDADSPNCITSTAAFITSASGSFIQNTNALQSGSTAYPAFLYVGSSASISGQLAVSSAIYVGNGSMGNPAHSFIADPKMGIYRLGANDMRIAINSLDDMKFTTNGAESFLQHNFADGTPAVPSLGFGGDTDTGFYRPGANQIGLVAGSIVVGTLTTTGLTLKSITWPDGSIQVSSPTSIGVYVASVTAGTTMKITGTNNIFNAAPIFNVDCASVTCEGQIVAGGGGGGYALEPATVTIKVATITAPSGSPQILISTQLFINSPLIVASTITSNNRIELSTYSVGPNTIPSIFMHSNSQIGLNFSAAQSMQFWQQQSATNYTPLVITNTEIDIATGTIVQGTGFIAFGNASASMAGSGTAIVISTTISVVTTSTAPSSINNGLVVGGHIEVSSTTPVISSCGSTPNGSVVGNDFTGKITIGGGVVTSCTMTFAVPWPNAPPCVTSSNTSITGATVATTTTALTLGAGATFAGDVVNYLCGGWR